MINNITKTNKKYYTSFYNCLKRRKISKVPEIVLRGWIIISNIKSCNSILDIGCGTCFLLNNLNSKKKYGVDIVNPPFLKKNIHFIKGDAKSAYKKLSNLKFNCIVFSHVLEHISNPYSILKRYLNLIDKNGKIIILLPISEDNEVHRNVNITKIVRLLKSNGFEISIEKNMYFRLKNYSKRTLSQFLFNFLFLINKWGFLPFIDKIFSKFKSPRQYMVIGRYVS